MVCSSAAPKRHISTTQSSGTLHPDTPASDRICSGGGGVGVEGGIGVEGGKGLWDTPASDRICSGGEVGGSWEGKEGLGLYNPDQS